MRAAITPLVGLLLSTANRHRTAAIANRLGLNHVTATLDEARP